MSDKNPFKPKANKAPQPSRPKATKSKGGSFLGGKTGNVFGSNALEVPEHYLKEAAELECEVRWVSSKELKENHGTHKRRWVAWKFKANEESGILDRSRFAFGAGDSEGVVRRGDLVLAIRPIAWCEEHRDELEQRRKRYNNHASSSKKAYKDFIKDKFGGDAEVDDGYDVKD